MLRFTKQLAFSNKKSLHPRGYWPIGRKFKPQPFNIYKPDKGDEYEFDNGIPTIMSQDLYRKMNTFQFPKTQFPKTIFSKTRTFFSNLDPFSNLSVRSIEYHQIRHKNPRQQKPHPSRELKNSKRYGSENNGPVERGKRRKRKVYKTGNW